MYAHINMYMYICTHKYTHSIHIHMFILCTHIQYIRIYIHLDTFLAKVLCINQLVVFQYKALNQTGNPKKVHTPV